MYESGHLISSSPGFLLSFRYISQTHVQHAFVAYSPPPPNRSVGTSDDTRQAVAGFSSIPVSVITARAASTAPHRLSTSSFWAFREITQDRVAWETCTSSTRAQTIALRGPATSTAAGYWLVVQA